MGSTKDMLNIRSTFILLFPVVVSSRFYVIKSKVDREEASKDHISGSGMDYNRKVHTILKPPIGSRMNVNCGPSSGIRKCQFVLLSGKKVSLRRERKRFLENGRIMLQGGPACLILIHSVQDEDVGTWRCKVEFETAGQRKIKKDLFHMFPTNKGHQSKFSTLSMISTTSMPLSTTTRPRPVSTTTEVLDRNCAN